MQKKQDLFKKAQRTVEKQGASLISKINKGAGRRNAIAAALIYAGAATVPTAAGMVGVSAFDDGVKKTISENYNLFLTVLMLGAFSSLFVMADLDFRKMDRNKAVADMAKKMGLDGTYNCEMAFGLVANYMTDAEYKKVEDLLVKWRNDKKPLPASFAENNEYIEKLAPIFNVVVDRTVGLRETLNDIISGKQVQPVALFQQEAKKIYAPKQQKDER